MIQTNECPELAQSQKFAELCANISQTLMMKELTVTLCQFGNLILVFMAVSRFYCYYDSISISYQYFLKKFRFADK